MKKTLKNVFQATAFVLAQVAVAEPAAAAQSAGVLYDNIASGLMGLKVKALFSSKP